MKRWQDPFYRASDGRTSANEKLKWQSDQHKNIEDFLIPISTTVLQPSRLFNTKKKFS